MKVLVKIAILMDKKINTTNDSNVVAFNFVLEVSEIVLISFNLFFFYPL